MTGTVRDLQGVTVGLNAATCRRAGVGREITMQSRRRNEKTQLSTKTFFFVGEQFSSSGISQLSN